MSRADQLHTLPDGEGQMTRRRGLGGQSVGIDVRGGRQSLHHPGWKFEEVIVEAVVEQQLDGRTDKRTTFKPASTPSRSPFPFRPYRQAAAGTATASRGQMVLTC